MPRTVSLTIDSVASGGDGVGRVDGLVVFVPRSAPGDVVTASVTGKGHFARGKLRSVVNPSPVRTEPICKHYVREGCGGCQLQHMTYESQLAAKQRMILDAMQRIGKRKVDPPPQVLKSANEWRYRTKLTLALRRRGERWIAGLHTYDDPSHVFAMVDCHITDTRVVTAWHDIMTVSHYLPQETDLRGSVRWTDEGATFLLSGGRRWSEHEQFFEAVPTLAALYWEPAERSRITLGDRRVIRTPAASFAQINPHVANELRRYVVARILSHSPTRVVDAYAGSGDVAVELSSRGIGVTTIELDAEAVAWSEERLPESAIAIRGRVEEVLPDCLPADVLLLNPPRTGLHPDVPETVRCHPPRAIVYVSCDPATLARDVSRLSGYRIASMIAFDMFPQTSHVETVCELVPESI